MNGFILFLFIVNLIISFSEGSTTKNVTLNRRIDAIETLTALSWAQIIIAFANLILCILRITDQFQSLSAPPKNINGWLLFFYIVVGFLSFVIITARFTPRQSSIRHYMDYWFTVNNRPTVEEFMDPNWSPTQDEDGSGHTESDVKEVPSTDTDDSVLRDESESLETDDDTEDADSLEKELLEMLENNDKLGALRLYMDDTDELLEGALEHIEGLIDEMGEQPELEFGDEGFDSEVDYNILLKSVNDGKTSAARYYSDVNFTDFIQAYDYVKELNEEFGNY